MQISSPLSKIVSIVIAFLVLVSTLMAITPPARVVTEVKNVIFMIGDGMGENHLEKTKQEMGISLVMETFPLRGKAKTYAFGGITTDSAAGGTALATGEKTINGCVGVYPTDPLAINGYPISLTEYAVSIGKKTGIVTTDSTGGATPATFSAHTSSRNNNEEIAKQQVESAIDLIWGKSAGVFDENATSNYARKYVSTLSQMNELTAGDKSYGQFTSDMWAESITAPDTPTLTEMTVKAIELLDNDGEGFFLMVEGAHIDKHSHSNNAADMMLSLIEFDNAIAAALDFAENDGETLVIVTADHETGKITFNGSTYEYESTSHSSADVPLFVFGCNGFINQDEVINNTQVAMLTAWAMGATPEEFPKKAA